MFCFTFVSDHNKDFLMLYTVQLKNMYSYHGGNTNFATFAGDRDGTA